MLKGSNTLTLNEATMKEAVEEYLVTHGGALTAGCKIDTIIQDSDINCRSFVISLSEKEKK